VCSLKVPADQLYRHGYEALQAMAEGLLFIVSCFLFIEKS